MIDMPVSTGAGLVGVFGRVLARKNERDQQKAAVQQKFNNELALEKRKTLYDTYRDVVKAEAERRGRADTENISALNKVAFFNLENDPLKNRKLQMELDKAKSDSDLGAKRNELEADRNQISRDELGIKQDDLGIKRSEMLINRGESLARRQHLIAQAGHMDALADQVRTKISVMKNNGVDLKTVNLMKNDLLQYRGQLLDLLKYDDDSLEDIFGDGFTVGKLGDKIKAVDAQLEHLNKLQETVAVPGAAEASVVGGGSAAGAAVAGGGGLLSDSLGGELKAIIDSRRAAGATGVGSGLVGGGDAVPLAQLFNKYDAARTLPSVPSDSLSMEDMYNRILKGER